MKKAIYAGSFDPPTNGHMWIIEQASFLFDELIIAIGKNPEKKYTYSSEERLELLNKLIEPFNNIKVVDIGLKILINYATDIGANYIIKGARTISDFEYEKQLSHFNERYNKNIKSIVLIAPKNLEDISSSFVKGLIGYDNWKNIISDYVPYVVFNKLLERKK